MSRCYFVFVWCLLGISLHAESYQDRPASLDRETEIKGIVRNDLGEPLSAVMIRVSFAGKDGPYVTTDRNGGYSLSFSSKESKVSVTFSKLGFEAETCVIDNTTQHLDMTMLKSASTLREVTVKAPDVRIQGDTITYLLSSYIGKGDISLKDALKRVPGIEVGGSGEISYNGKKISNFYIEGMDMLGGKYDIATTNIPAKYVNAIEVLNNHQDVKIDRRRFNDNVALNVKLNPKAKFRPLGTYSFSGGFGKRPVPLGATGAGMLFRDNFQSILTLKGSDIEEFSNRENIRFFGMGNATLPNYTSIILGSLAAANPPLERKRWIKPIDAASSVNFVNKLNEDISVRTNVSYSFQKNDYDYSDSRFYFDGSGNIVIQQTSKPESRKHQPAFSVEYKLNRDDLYFTNDLSGTASFSSDILQIETNAGKIHQYQNMKNFNIRDVLRWGWKRGKLRWNYSSAIECMSSPEGVIVMSDNNQKNMQLEQTGRSYSILVDESISGILEIKRSHLFFPLSIKYSNTKLCTTLSYSNNFNKAFEKGNSVESTENNIDGAKNRVNGSKLNFCFSPEYDYSSPYDQVVIRMTCPLGCEYLDLNNTGTNPLISRSTQFLFNPSLYLNYKLSSKSTIRLISSYNTHAGDILDLLTAPVMTDYISMSYHSGILSKKNTFSATLHYDFKLPISSWYFNAEAAYTNSQNNLISCQDVSAGLIAVTDMRLPHSTDNISTNIGISKNLREINTKISLKGSCNRTCNEILQNDFLVNYFGTGANLTGEILSCPVRWCEINYNMAFSSSSSRYMGRKQSFSTQSHHASISIFPISSLQIKVETDITRREIEENRYKTNSLFDAGITYKFSKFKFNLNLRNILNCKNYSYTLFSGLDKFTYNYSLRGREIIAAVDFTL